MPVRVAEVPNADYPFVDNNGLITLPWRQFLAALFERTGGASGSASVEVGTITAYGGTDAPDGWLTCDGSAVSRTIFSRLYGVIGDTWGDGNGFDTFNLPNLVGKFPRGSVPSSPYDVGGLGGNDSIQLTTNEMPTHFHAITAFEHTHLIDDPGHTHTITMDGHVHGITDPGHTHDVTDPEHVHTIGSDTLPGAGIFVVQAANDIGDITTDQAPTGITIDTAVTGITETDSAMGGATIDPAFTDITILPSVAKAQTEVAGQGFAFPILPAFAAVMYIIKT